VRTIKLLTVAVLTSIGLSLSAQAPDRPAASALLTQSITAMGGEARLTSLSSLTLDGIGHYWALEQSERPEGPFLAIYRQRVEVRDLVNKRRWSQSQQRFWSAAQWTAPSVTVVANGVAARQAGTRWGPGSPNDVADFDETLALAPERLLFTARDAADLRKGADATVQRMRHDVVTFTRNGQKLKLFLNGYTHLPTQLEIVKDDRFGIWGDVTERRLYSFWTREAGGLMYPRQTTTQWNELPFSDETVLALTVDAPIDETKFAIPDDAKAAFAKLAASAPPPGAPLMANLTVDEARMTEVAPDVWQIAGGFNVGVVKQSDGLIVIEGTTSGGYSKAIVTLLEKKFPGVAIKAVVTTSDAWPHVGGIREYIARGKPIYALDLNVSILSHIAESPRTFSPDTLSKAPRPPVFKPVAAKTTLGSGETRIELIPVRGEMGERMMLAWLPGRSVLYSSDLIQPNRPGVPGFFMIGMVAEVDAAVQREGVTGIQTVFGMHLPPTPWATVQDALKK